MGIKNLVIGNKDLFIVTIRKGNDTNMLVAKKGERIKVLDNRFLTVGNEVPEHLKEKVTMDPVTSDNKYKVKMIKKEQKKKNKK